MSAEIPCGYCGHPAGVHFDGRCFNDTRAIGGGWRDCTCSCWAEPQETTA